MSVRIENGVCTIVSQSSFDTFKDLKWDTVREPFTKIRLVGYKSCDLGSFTEAFPQNTPESAYSVDLGSVKYILNSAFINCGYVNVVAENVEAIGQLAFKKSKLLSIKIPKCTRLSEQCFYDCKYLEKIECPIVGNVESWVFGGCSGLSTISFSSDISRSLIIGKEAFVGCVALTSIEWNNRYINDIKSHAFKECTSLKKLPPIILDNEISKEAFANSSISHVIFELRNINGTRWEYTLDKKVFAQSIVAWTKLPNYRLRYEVFDDAPFLDTIVFEYPPQKVYGHTGFSKEWLKFKMSRTFVTTIIIESLDSPPILDINDNIVPPDYASVVKFFKMLPRLTVVYAPEKFKLIVKPICDELQDYTVYDKIQTLEKTNEIVATSMHKNYYINSSTDQFRKFTPQQRQFIRTLMFSAAFVNRNHGFNMQSARLPPLPKEMLYHIFSFVDAGFTPLANKPQAIALSPLNNSSLNASSSTYSLNDSISTLSLTDSDTSQLYEAAPKDINSPQQQEDVSQLYSDDDLDEHDDSDDIHIQLD